jgi:hypothetical protein
MDTNEKAVVARWEDENDPKNKNLVELYEKLKQAPLDCWRKCPFYKGISIGKISIYFKDDLISLHLFNRSGERVIDIPDKVNKSWVDLYHKVFEYLGDEEKYKDVQAIKSAIQQVDNHIKDNMKD